VEIVHVLAVLEVVGNLFACGLAQAAEAGWMVPAAGPLLEPRTNDGK
jgi:hypothetical protein